MMLTRYFSAFALLFVALFLTACSTPAVIVHNLDERDANEILTYLNDRGIEAVKVAAEAAGGAGKGAVVWNIEVSKERSNEAMALLNAAGLPRRATQNLLGIFTNTGLVPSETGERIRYQAGLAAQLSSVIRKFDGVLDAEVQLSFPKEDALNPNAPKGTVTASVYVKHNGVLDDPNSHLETKIRRFVASSVPSLNFDNVTVVGERARFGEGGAEFAGSTPTPEKTLVSIWSIVIAKESVTRFRVIFFSFFVAIIVLVILLIWLIWKIIPFLQRHGIMSLFSIHPFKAGEIAAVEAQAETHAEETQATPEAGTGTEEENKADTEKRP